jgi:hypothetical protein
MAAFTNYLETKILNHLFSATSFTKPSSVWIGLVTSATDIATGDVTEPSVGGYLRVQMLSTTQTIANGMVGKWTNDELGLVANGIVVQFPVATADWGLCTHFAVWDVASGVASPNLLMCAPLAAPRDITTGTAPKFEIGTLKIRLN